jgi:hypothetical protein
MDPFKNNDVRPPLRELSNNTLEGIPTNKMPYVTSQQGFKMEKNNGSGGRANAMQRKRERERARYAVMSDEKNELKKRRESRTKENLEHHKHSKGMLAIPVHH